MRTSLESTNKVRQHTLAMIATRSCRAVQRLLLFTTAKRSNDEVYERFRRLYGQLRMVSFKPLEFAVLTVSGAVQIAQLSEAMRDIGEITEQRAQRDRALLRVVDPIESLLSSADANATCYARALAVNREELSAAQESNDVMHAFQALRRGFNHDVGQYSPSPELKPAARQIRLRSIAAPDGASARCRSESQPQARPALFNADTVARSSAATGTSPLRSGALSTATITIGLVSGGASAS